MSRAQQMRFNVVLLSIPTALTLTTGGMLLLAALMYPEPKLVWDAILPAAFGLVFLVMLVSRAWEGWSRTPD